MNTTNVRIRQLCQSLRLSALAENNEPVFRVAEEKQPGYRDFTILLLETELKAREEKQFSRKIRDANLPLSHDLDSYDFTFNNGLKPAQINQLKELVWLEQNFNIILLGPSGVGKTFLAAGLCHHAIKAGYKALFRNMEQIMDVLRLKDVSRSAMTEYKRITAANLIVIDDIMLMPVTKTEAVKLFSFINMLFEKASFIITTNKSPQQWVEMLDDEVLATALLDRLLFKCQVLSLEGKSYRLLNRKTIFDENNEKNID